MKKMRDRMMPLDRRAPGPVYGQIHVRLHARRIAARQQMQEGVAALLRVDNMPKAASIAAQFSHVSHLSAHFRVSRAFVQDDRRLLIKRYHVDDLRRDLQPVVPLKFRGWIMLIE